MTGQNRSTQRRSPAATTPADPDVGLRALLRDWAKSHPRRGFRPAYHVARADGWQVNHKKMQRLWGDEGLRVPQRRRRKRLGASTAGTVPVADALNAMWRVISDWKEDYHHGRRHRALGYQAPGRGRRWRR
jgi:putative transposase